MSLKNTPAHYGTVMVAIHWLVAFVVFGLFALGAWMVDLTYYSEWYKTGPDIHRSVGVLLFFLMLFRVVWKFANTGPRPVPSHKRWETVAALAAHGVLYVLLFIAMVSGYLISTADGSAISVFGWFDVPSVTGQIKGMEDVAGSVHYWSTLGILILAVIHALGALKHHFLDRDETLTRMLGH